MRFARLITVRGSEPGLAGGSTTFSSSVFQFAAQPPTIATVRFGVTMATSSFQVQPQPSVLTGKPLSLQEISTKFSFVSIIAPTPNPPPAIKILSGQPLYQNTRAPKPRPLRLPPRTPLKYQKRPGPRREPLMLAPGNGGYHHRWQHLPVQSVHRMWNSNSEFCGGHITRR